MRRKYLNLRKGRYRTSSVVKVKKQTAIEKMYQYLSKKI